MKRFILACMVLFMSVSAVFAQSDLQVLAVIKMNKNESITVKQLKARVNTYQKQIGKALTVDEKKMVLDALIEERLILQAAQKIGLWFTKGPVWVWVQEINRFSAFMPVAFSMAAR